MGKKKRQLFKRAIAYRLEFLREKRVHCYIGVSYLPVTLEALVKLGVGFDLSLPSANFLLRCRDAFPIVHVAIR